MTEYVTLEILVPLNDIELNADVWTEKEDGETFYEVDLEEHKFVVDGLNYGIIGSYDENDLLTQKAIDDYKERAKVLAGKSI